MADPVMRRLVQNALFVLVLLASLPAMAQSGALPDPTRPPGVNETSTQSAPAPTGLQAVVLRPQGHSVAVINGKTVAVGDKVGDARLVLLTAEEAVLVGPNGKEVLKLVPTVDKNRVASEPAAKKAKKRNPRRGKSHD
jgi:MSHA biogenesis protein MshK